MLLLALVFQLLILLLLLLVKKTIKKLATITRATRKFQEDINEITISVLPQHNEELTITPLISLYDSSNKKIRKHKDNVSSKDQNVHPFQDAPDTSTKKRTASQDALPLKKRKTRSTTNLELRTRDEFELVSSQDPTPPKNPSSDFTQELPNRITRTNSLSNYIETTPSSSINPTPSTSRASSVTSNIRPSIDHDICADTSSDSDTNNVVLERELYPGESKTGATTYKRVSADNTSAISNRYFINEITKNKVREHKGIKELRDMKKKHKQLKLNKKNTDTTKKKVLEKKKKEETKKQSNMMDKFFIKPNHSPDSSPTTATTSPSGTASTEFSTEDDSEMIDDNSFNCLDTTHSIEPKSFVAFKEVKLLERVNSKRNIHQTNYLIARVESVIDNKSYNLKFLEYVKNKMFKPYYTWDVQRPGKIISNKDELVLLKAPHYLYQPKEVKQGAKIAPEHTNKIHNFFFPNFLQETVQSHFENMST